MNGSLDSLLTLQNIVTFFAVLFRTAGIFVASPLLSNQAVPARIKICLAIALSVVLFPIVKQPSVLKITTHWQLVILVFQEITIGVIVGYVASLLFAAVNTAGELIAGQIGFSMASIFDPANEGSSAVLTTLYAIMGAIIFLYINGHHVILFGLAKSFEFVPIGGGFNMDIGYSLQKLTSVLFSVSVQLAAPLFVVMTVLNFIFGLLTKLSPQLNIYFNAGFAITPLVGLIVIMISLPLFRVLMTHMTEQLTPDLLKIVHDLKKGV